MRALLDTNILVSYLLGGGEESPVDALVTAALEGRFTLLLPEEVVREFAEKVGTKPYLAQRITTNQAERFVQMLRETGEVVEAVEAEIPRVVRDPRDDYLLAYALVGRAEYLVTGDDDLLSLGEVEGLRITSPREFVRLLAGRAEPDS